MDSWYFVTKRFHQLTTIPDYTIEPTEIDIQQVRETRENLKLIVGEESMYFYISPSWKELF